MELKLTCLCHLVLRKNAGNTCVSMYWLVLVIFPAQLTAA